MWKKLGRLFKGNTLRSFDKEDANALMAVGDKLFQIERYKEALEYFDKALAIMTDLNIKDNTSLANALKKMGEVYDNLGKYGKAVIYYEQAASLDKGILRKQPDFY